MNFRTIDDLDVKGKHVVVRADLNVPMKDGVVTNTARIDRTVPTLKELAERGAKVVILTHLGRPGGERNMEFTVEPVAKALEKALGKKVTFVHDCIGDEAVAAVKALKEGEFALMENLRFYKEETKNDSAFAKKLAELGELYVSDAFSASHRAHASTAGVAQYLTVAAGRLMQAEIEALTNALEAPKKPVMAVVGGAKVSTKLEVLHNLVKKVDYLVVGGGMANTFLNAKGIDIKGSLCEHEMAEECRIIIGEAEVAGCEILLPKDARLGKEFKEGTEVKQADIDNLPDDYLILDDGDKTIAELKAVLENVKTVLWNGPLGVFEIKPFDTATNAIALDVAKRTQDGQILSVAGGGDTVAALQASGAAKDFSYISTAGGAFLEWMEGKELPGVAILRK
ncbi:MAG: phosphoglycerate kinase [Alphaproteobacteria bacterium]